MKILVIDDEEIALSSVRRILEWRGFKQVDVCNSGRDAIRLIRDNDYDIVLLDLLMPEVDGLQVLEATKPYKPYTEFIVVTALDDIPTTVAAVRRGAYDYLVKPVDNDLLLLTIERAYERKGLMRSLSNMNREADRHLPEAFSEIITKNTAMKALLSFAATMARSGNPILITGDSGTGKELLAKGIHQCGPHPEGPFVAVNVSAIPTTMFETQFFGHVRGAFTGAEANYRGFFEQAHGGTLFLDEIGELPYTVQAKLLRVLEDKVVTPLGGTKSIHVDVRIISATNMDIDQACQEGHFRLDLLYRLKSTHIHLPPLREREGDIPLLAHHFVHQANQKYGKNVTGFATEAMDMLLHGNYPGNVRELSQIIDNAVCMAEATLIMPHHLGRTSSRSSMSSRRLCSLKENEETHVAYVLINTGGNRKQAADILGITVRQLQRKIAQMRGDPLWSHVLGDI